VRGRAFALALLFSRIARASNVLEIPDNGSEAMARGGAWIAKASDPLATFFNPAGLAGQATQLTLQTNIVVQHTCFTRIRAESDTSIDPLASADGRFPRVCSDIEPALNPQIGASVRLSERLGIGVLVYGPAAAGRATWPELVDAGGERRPAPQRYLLTRQSAVLAFPTVGIGYRVFPDLRIGASAGWGIAHVKSALATVALASGAQNADNDIRANLQVKDLFVPRITAGAIWNVTQSFDLAGTWQWTDRIRARGDLGTATSYWSAQNVRGDDSGVGYADTFYSDCGTGRPADEGKCGDGGNATLSLPIPMEAKLAMRVHGQTRRDDFEVDLTWANDSALDVVRLRFPGDAAGNGRLPLAGINAFIPPNADQPRRYRDVLGIRAGGDVEIIPSFVVRGGAYFETAAGRGEYQRLDVAATERFGIALGGAWRLPMERVRAELLFGYGHTFVADARRGDRNATGIGAIAGTPPYRTAWPVNLGTITNAVNTLNVGAVVGF
jgi:long-subunit fatty acid transport protein